ncbi:type I-B CRISPR-associated endonuclease Cas1b [Tepidanaerobacter sp. EBM-38]|uniref:type I-B CRISPR-associated endonuclease Cas1b n=1 Tax=Tepidanaerobacter sp. EBM-38 TaxID=1918496 RepID=UPI000A42FD75|nr:type I-B CRISPR-associated endonuclease Cas1b [Tepidanaerobacter sp. EBM-38]
MKKPIYIFSSGELKRKDNTIFFENEAGRKYIPVENTSEIYIFGEVDINKRFLEFITQAEIILHFFNYYGYYVGTYYPREHLNSGYMVLKQAEHYLDFENRLRIASEFVAGASKNMQQVIRYYLNRGKNLQEIEEIIKTLSNKISLCNNIEELMAIEGNIRENYYGAFDNILENEDFAFKRRTRRPPKNNLNTLISFGNSMIYTMVLSEIYKTHLDPRIGFLHATNFRRFTLNLDVAEIFKPIIVDRVIFTVIGKKMLTADDFEKSTEGLLLKESGKKIFIAEMEKKLKTTFKHKTIGREVSYRRLIRLELYKLEKHLMGEEKYEAFVARW